MDLKQFLPAWFFQSCEGSLIGSMIQQSKWAFAVIETIHLMALAILLGSFLIVDLRLFGLAMRRQTVAEVAEQFMPTSWVALVIMAISGIPMYLSEAVRLSAIPAFFYKMVFLSLALLFHLTVYQRVTKSDSNADATLARISAALSLTCWLAVALAGRAIAFL